MKRFDWLIYGTALLLGCGEVGPAEGPAARRDSAGIEIVTNEAADRVLGWDFEKVLSLGGADSGVESFYQVPHAGLAFDESGQIYVLDAGNKRVLLFDGAGAHIRTLGREGQGPGEFRYPSRLAVEPTGAVGVYDLGQRGLIRFDTAGSYVGQVPISGSVHTPVRVDGSRLVFATQQREPATGERIFRLHRIASHDSTALLTIPLPDVKMVHFESCGLGVPLGPLFSDPPSWDARARRVVFADAPHYSIRVFEDGIETRHVRRSMTPEAATREHAMRELGDGEEWYVPRTGDCFVPAPEIMEARGIADHVPVLEKVAVSPDGYVWAQRDVIGEDDGPIDVFDATGEYLGTLPPATPWPVDFGPGGLILALEENELGVQFAVAYRVRQG